MEFLLLVNKGQVPMMAGLNPHPTVEVLYPAGAKLGECPVYEEETGTLIWVDIDSGTINFLDPIAKTNRELKLSSKLSAAIPVEQSPEKLIVPTILPNAICIVDRHTGDVIETLATLDSDTSQAAVLMNDAKCDSSGRLWFGTRGEITDPNKVESGGGVGPGAALYSYSKGVVTKFSDCLVSNGIAWNNAEDTLYHVDTVGLKIYQYAFDKTTGNISNKEILIDFQSSLAHGEPLLADGLCVDMEGRLWVAMCSGQCITCWDPKTRERVQTVKFPKAKNITSCCFGGPNYEWLFVTSGKFMATEEELAENTNSGAIFVIKDLGARGMPSHKFRI